MGRKKDSDKISFKQRFKSMSKEDQVLIRLIQAGRKDPVFFAEKLLGLTLHDGQKLWLWMTTKRQTEKAFELGVATGRWNTRAEFDKIFLTAEFLRNILVPSNRWGKTVTTSVKHIWVNFYKIGVRGTSEHVMVERCGTLNLSPHSNQCQAGYDYILDILSSKFTWIMNGESKKNECKIGDFLLGQQSQKRQINFKNGTTYRAVPTGEDQAASLAGTPYLYISYDECAQSLHLRNELPAKIMSRLIDYGGPLDLVSTPEVDKPSHQYFSRIAKLGMKGEEGWFTLVGKLTDNVFLGEKQRDSVIASIKATDPAKYRQVAFGDFVTTGKKMFDNLVIERIFDKEKPEPTYVDHQYVVVADWGFADTGDPTVFYIIDHTPDPLRVALGKEPTYRIVYAESIKGGSPFAVLARAKMLQREWNGAKFVHDANALGGVVIKKMLREMEMYNMVDFSGSGGQKAEMLFTLLVVLSSDRQTKIDEEMRVTDTNPNFGRLRSYLIPELEEQLGNYAYNPASGVTDKKLEQDHVMALGMGIWYLERRHYKTKVAQVDFNPLAPTLETIFTKKTAIALKMRAISIPEKRIY